MHGYQMVSELVRRDARDWAAVSRPQVYYSIKKLADLNLISPLKPDGASLGPERTEYEITSRGKAMLTQELAKEDWAQDRSPPPFLTWMALSSNLSRRETLKVFRARREFLKRELERERETLKAVEADSGPMITAARLMVGLTAELFETELRWLNKAEQELSAARKGD